MPILVKARSFLRNLFFSRHVEMDLDAEVFSHLALLTEENIQAGMSPPQARRAAHLELGGVEQVKEQVREATASHLLHTGIADFRYGLRQLRKNPGFAVVAVLTLALGIAVNATMFSLVSAFLLRRPPGFEPDRIAVVTSINPTGKFLPDANPVSVPNYLAWRDANSVFADTAAADEYRSVNLSSNGQPEVVRSAAVSANFFRVLGMSPQLGRTFADKEDQFGRDRVVVLSHELWKRRFASDALVVGRTIRINREDYTVVGVMPESFKLLGYTPQLWTPVVFSAAEQSVAGRKDRSLYVFARLKPGITLDQARAELSALARRAEEAFPETEKGWGAAVRTLPDFLVYGFAIRSALGMIMTTVGFVLMIACANVAGLLMARAAGRRKELAIRVALGAGRIRIVRQLLSENLLIAFFGGALGLLLSEWGVRLLRANLNFNDAMIAVPLSLDRNVFVFAVLVSLICAVLCGIAPALNASRTDVNVGLKDESRAASASRSRTRLRSVMVTGEIALSLFLLIGAGLLFQGILQIERQNLGFRAEHLLTAGVALDTARYRDARQQMQFVRDVLPRLERLPGVESVAGASDLPATGPGSVTFRIKGQPDLSSSERRSALHAVVTADYFRVAGIPLLRGRTFTELDDVAAPRTLLVNQEFVRRALNDQEPLGQQIQLDVSGADPEWSEIVGVVGNVKTYSEGTREEPEVYESFLQRPVSSFVLMVRSNPDPNSLASAVRHEVSQIDGELPLDRVMSMAVVIEQQRSGNPFFVGVLGSFAVLALILAAIGIYGLVAYSVGQRTHEIGIRMALGAGVTEVRRMVLWEGVKLTAIGGSVGLIMALPLPKLFNTAFYDLRVRGPQLYFIVPIVILLVTMLAAYIPARRASRVDPMVALHQD